MKISKKQRIAEAIYNHGQRLKEIFNLHWETEPVKLCKQLFQIENKMHRLATDWCNGVIDDDQWQEAVNKAVKKLNTILGTNHGIPIQFNGDARGYCLKIKDEWMRENGIHNLYQDMGGYGILAPDFREVY